MRVVHNGRPVVVEQSGLRWCAGVQIKLRIADDRVTVRFEQTGAQQTVGDVLAGHQHHVESAAGAIKADRTITCAVRSEEHTYELQSLMRISYAVFCLNKKNYSTITTK